MHLHCKIWNLSVNPAKTKVVFSIKSKLKNISIFTPYEQVFNVESDFLTLEFILIKIKISNFKAKLRFPEQARKTSFSILKNARELCLPADIQLKLFDHMTETIF